MASLKQPGSPNHSQKELSILKKTELDRSYHKKQTYPKTLTKRSPNCFRSTKSTCSLTSTKTRNQISFSDFWSNRMKAEVRNLEKQMMPYSICAKTSRNPRQEFEFFPEIHRNVLKSKEFYKNSSRISQKPLELVPALEKIIGDCEVFRKKARRLSLEISISNKVLHEEYQKFYRSRVL